MIELTAKERETVIQILRKHPNAGPDVDVEGFLKEKPLASHFFAMAARGLMKDRRVGTRGFLRSFPVGPLGRRAAGLGGFQNLCVGGAEVDSGLNVVVCLL